MPCSVTRGDNRICRWNVGEDIRIGMRAGPRVDRETSWAQKFMALGPIAAACRTAVGRTSATDVARATRRTGSGTGGRGQDVLAHLNLPGLHHN